MRELSVIRYSDTTELSAIAEKPGQRIGSAKEGKHQMTQAVETELSALH
jgi:hypothetical protein